MITLIKKLLLGLCATLCLTGIASAGEHGTKDEAVAMVKKAAAYLKENGKEKAFAEFMKPQGQFRDRDMFINATSLDGVSLAHPNSKIVGKNVLQLKDVDGKAFIQSYIDIAKSKGKGWVDYKWPDPNTHEIDKKTTYVELVDGVILGCGIYK